MVFTNLKIHKLGPLKTFVQITSDPQFLVVVYEVHFLFFGHIPKRTTNY